MNRKHWLCLWVSAAALVILSSAAAAVGPAGATLMNSDEWGSGGSVFYTNQLLKHQALTIDTGLGNDVFHFMMNWGWEFLPKQRLKVMARHYAQRIRLDFTGASEQDWMGQELAAVAYQGQIPAVPLLTWQASAYLGRARDENFGAHVMSGQTVIREATGALLTGINGWVDGPLPGMGQIGGGLYYDSLNYNMAHEADKSRDGMGIKIRYSKGFMDLLNAYASAEWRSPFNRYQLGGQLKAFDVPSSKLVFGGEVQRIEPELPFDREVRYVFSLNYFWGPGKANENGKAWDLNQWVAQPAADIPEVYIIRDQAVR